MAKRSSMLEDLFTTLIKVPWWLGVGVAIAIWLIGRHVLGNMADNSVTDMIRPLFRLLYGAMAVVALIAALVSAVRTGFRRKLVDRQTGLPSLRDLSWREFEQLVGEAYRRQGYDVEETGGGGADGGVDLVLRGNGETVLVQCKQWRAQQVGVEKVRELFGVVTAEGADRGILVTSGQFTRDAESFKVGKPLVLVDGPALARLVRDVQKAPVPPTTTQSAASAARDETVYTCPLCGGRMVLRTAKRGAHAGSSFYGCARYPACKGTRPA